MPEEDDLGLMMIGLRGGKLTIHTGQEKRKGLSLHVLVRLLRMFGITI
jgi:hypothetical protein